MGNEYIWKIIMERGPRTTSPSSSSSSRTSEGKSLVLHLYLSNVGAGHIRDLYCARLIDRKMAICKRQKDKKTKRQKDKKTKRQLTERSMQETKDIILGVFIACS